MPTEIVVPDLGESIVEATVAEWLKKEGDPVKIGEAVVTLETEKVDLEVGAQADGVLGRIVRQSGEDVRVGDVLGIIEETAAAPSTPEPERAAARVEEKAQVPKEADKPPVKEDVPEKVSPVARRVAQERGIDLGDVPASGPRGRVTKEDVEQYVAQRDNGQQTAPSQPQPVTARDQREERIRMSRRRRTIAERLVEAQHTAAMLTTFNEIDMSAVMTMRQEHKESFKERHEIGLGITSFFVKGAIGALKAFPQINAEIEGNDIILKHYYDIGVAIGAPEGLVVPVLRDADRMSFADIEKAIKDFADRAENNTLSLDDLRGGTFTITNGGVFGSLMSTPILNPPQVGILGLHKIEQRPVAVNEEVVSRPMMYVALSYDHRIVDGREAVQFLVRIKTLLEDLDALLLEG